MGGCSSPNTLLVALRRAFPALGVLSVKMGSAVLGGGGWKVELEAGRWVRHWLGGVCGKFLLQDLLLPPPRPHQPGRPPHIPGVGVACASSGAFSHPAGLQPQPPSWDTEWGRAADGGTCSPQGRPDHGDGCHPSPCTERPLPALQGRWLQEGAGPTMALVGKPLLWGMPQQGGHIPRLTGMGAPSVYDIPQGPAPLHKSAGCA